MELSFIDIFGVEVTAGPDWSKKFIKPISIDFAFETLRKLAILDMAGFNSKLP